MLRSSIDILKYRLGIGIMRTKFTTKTRRKIVIWVKTLSASLASIHKFKICGQLQSLKKNSPVTGLEWPREFQEVNFPRFHDKGTGWW